MASGNMKNENDNSRLLNLPPELRNMIYEHVLSSQEAIKVPGREHRYPNGRLKSTSWHFQLPPLLHTSHQIRMEAVSIYYSVNIFKFPLAKLRGPLADFGPFTQHRHLLKRFQVESFVTHVTIDLTKPTSETVSYEHYGRPRCWYCKGGRSRRRRCSGLQEGSLAHMRYAIEDAAEDRGLQDGLLPKEFEWILRVLVH